MPSTASPSPHALIGGAFSYRSRLAFGSCVSCCALCSCLSALSVLSAGSVLSVLSIGSTTSVLSIASVNSRMSIGSNGCTWRIFANCAQRSDDGLEMDVHIDPDTWEFMKNCTFFDYQRFKTHETTEKSPCDYQSAACVYRGRGGFANSRACTVRRKGFSTWRDIDDAPSLKIKFKKDEGGSKDFDFGDVGRQRLVADKVTINNMRYSNAWNGYDEVDAYDTFYRIQGSHIPIASRITTRAFRGTQLMWQRVHALVEDVSNDDYFKRIGVRDLLLLEMDNKGTEFKDAEGVWENAPVGAMEEILNRPSELHDRMDRDEVLGYYVADVITQNWDGALLDPTPVNFYVLVTGNDTAKPHVRYIPKGLDWVFQGCVYDLYTDGGRPFDGPTQHMMEAHASDLARIREYAATHVPHTSMTCGQEVGIALAIAVASTTIAFLVLACALVTIQAYVAQTAQQACVTPPPPANRAVAVRTVKLHASSRMRSIG